MLHGPKIYSKHILKIEVDSIVFSDLLTIKIKYYDFTIFKKLWLALSMNFNYNATVYRHFSALFLRFIFNCFNVNSRINKNQRRFRGSSDSKDKILVVFLRMSIPVIGNEIRQFCPVKGTSHAKIYCIQQF